MTIFVLACSLLLFSSDQLTVSVINAEGGRGQIIDIPVICSGDSPTAGACKIKFQYKPDMLRISSIISSPNFAFRCENSDITIGSLLKDTSDFTVSCDNFSFPGNRDTLFVITAEILAGPDTLTFIKPVEMTIDNVASDFVGREGTVKINSDPIFRKFPENLGNNYPNPFKVFTFFPFTVKYDTRVNFQVWSLSGRLQAESASDPELFSAYSADDPAKVPVGLNSTFSKGSYILVYTPDPTEISSGIYYMQMITGIGAYNTGFLYVK